MIRVDFQYDGSRFLGYQSQNDPNKRTVQAELEKALERILGEFHRVFVSGRTDTGVHALHQVISFKTRNPIPVDGLKKALNAFLPKDIRIIKISQEPYSFHARFSPKRRTYLYIIRQDKNFFPFEHSYVWNYPFEISYSHLKKALKCFVGTHDFQSFCEKPSTNNTVRTIYKIKVKKKKQYFYIYIQGNAFLRRMIRVIVGTCVHLATQKKEVSLLKIILAYKKRGANPFPTAPPNGLYFYKVHF